MIDRKLARLPKKNKGRKENKMTYAVRFETDLVNHYFPTPRSVYYHLIQHFFNHDTAANAEGWCELASVGEEYEDSDFNGEFEESFNISVRG